MLNIQSEGDWKDWHVRLKPCPTAMQCNGEKDCQDRIGREGHAERRACQSLLRKL